MEIWYHIEAIISAALLLISLLMLVQTWLDG